jgi:predicted nucleic acid-binding protein
MRVVSNTSPICNLAIIGRLELLPRRYGGVSIPREVALELGELLHARLQGWIPNLRDEIARLRLHAGFFVDAEIEAFITSQVGE